MALIVNGEVIDDSSIQNEAERLKSRMREAMPGEDPAALQARAQEWARDNVIEQVLLRQAALSEGVPIDVLLERWTARLAPPKSKEITEYYRKHRDEFYSTELVHAAHIVKNADEQRTAEAALEQIQEIRAEWKQGADFAELADRSSDCPGHGGDLGYIARGQMVSEFETVVFALQPGEVSEIFRTPFGYHVARVFDRKPEGVRPLNDVKDHVEALLYGQKRQRRIDQFLDGLRVKADIQQP